MQVAQTIQAQIRALDKFAMMDWGSKDLVATREGLQFTASGAVKFKGKVHVKYNAGTDLYTVEFFKIRKFEVIVVKTVADVYADQLVSVIDAQVLGR